MRITLDHASVTLGGIKALSDVSLTLGPGETLLVLGSNGSGKSTLLRLLRGDLWPDDDGRGTRAYRTGDGPGRASPIGVRHRFGLVSPEIQRTTKRLWGHLTAETVILSGPREAMYVQGGPSPTEVAVLDDVLTRLSIEHLRHAPVASLSNGQLRAVLLARALACRPAVLFLDEFLDGLDGAAAVAASRAMAEAAAGGAAVVLTSHAAAQLPKGPARGIVLEQGRLTHDGSAASARSVYRNGQADNAADASDDQAGPGHGPGHPGDSCAPDGRGAATSPLPRPGQPAASGPTGSGLPLVAMERVSVFLNRRRILRDVSLTVAAGGHMAVLGTNGSGKSTLLKLMAGEHHPALGGRVTRPGLTAPEGLTDLRDIRRRIGLVSFELEVDYDKAITALEVVVSGIQASIGLYVAPTKRDVAAGKRWMDFFGVADLAARRLGALSAGQTRRLFLARAMVAGPRLLLLDEPFSGLDTASRALAMQAVSAAARSGTTVVCAVHHPGDIIAEIQTVARLENGRVSLDPPACPQP
ncbi:ATP-binding cassette domain-containing protein [Solidesulfovibrio sp.]